METVLRELQYASRQVRRSPGFSISAVLMLALGIGATTATFSIVEGILLRPLPFPDPTRLVALSDTLERVEVGPGGEAGVTAPEIRTYIRDTNTFENLGGYQPGAYELSGTDEPSPTNGARLSSGVFAALGVPPLLGRVFTQQEDDERQQVVVLSYSLWRSRFHGDPHILGTKLLLDPRNSRRIHRSHACPPNRIACKKALVFYRLFRIAVPSGVPRPVQASHPGPAVYPLTVLVIALVPTVTSRTMPFATLAYRNGFRKPTFFCLA